MPRLVRMRLIAITSICLLTACPGEPNHPEPDPPTSSSTEGGGEASSESSSADGDECGGADECAEGAGWGSTTG